MELKQTIWITYFKTFSTHIVTCGCNLSILNLAFRGLFLLQGPQIEFDKSGLRVYNRL